MKTGKDCRIGMMLLSVIALILADVAPCGAQIPDSMKKKEFIAIALMPVASTRSRPIPTIHIIHDTLQTQKIKIVRNGDDVRIGVGSLTYHILQERIIAAMKPYLFSDETLDSLDGRDYFYSIGMYCNGWQQYRGRIRLEKGYLVLDSIYSTIQNIHGSVPGIEMVMKYYDFRKAY